MLMSAERNGGKVWMNLVQYVSGNIYTLVLLLLRPLLLLLLLLLLPGTTTAAATPHD